MAVWLLRSFKSKTTDRFVIVTLTPKGALVKEGRACVSGFFVSAVTSPLLVLLLK